MFSEVNTVGGRGFIAQIAVITGVGRTTIKAWLKDADGRIIVI